MKLRDSVRPPQRYDAEFVYQPVTRRGQRSSSARNYVDYNPNLPPAAFPTLDKPRPMNNSQSQHVQDKKTDQDGDVDMDDDGDHDHHDELPHISNRDIDNYVASNGPQNPIYARNMARLEQANRESSLDSDMSDSQDDGDPNKDDDQNIIEEPLPQNPEWKDLSPNLQTEIVENLMSIHSWSKTLSLLGVTYEEAKVIRQHFEGRNRQIQQENLYLQEMQAKQLRALMRIDNSDLKAHKVPSQLVFRKTSRQFTRRLRDSIGTDYLLCQAKDLLLARRFLSRRGLDPRYAGEWNNDFVYLPKSQNEDQEMFEWKDNYHFDETSGPEEHVSDIASSPPIMEEQSLQSQADFLNNLGGHDVANFRGYQGHPPSTYRVPMISNSYSNEMRNHINYEACGIVRLRVGSEQAARIRDLEQPSEWTGLSNHYITGTDVRPSRQRNTLDSNGQHARAESSRNYSRKLPVAGNFELPVRRVMGGQWSYSSLEPKPSSMPTSSVRYRGRSEQVRETQTQETEANAISVASTAENIDNAITSQSSSQQNKGGASSVTEMPSSSDTCIPDPVISLDSKEVQTNSAFPSSDTNLERHSTPIRNISVRDSQHKPQPAPIAPPSDNICSSAEGKRKLEDSVLSVVKPSASGPTIENSHVDEEQDEERKFQTPAVGSRSAGEKKNGEDAESKIKKDANVEVLMHSEEDPSNKVEAQPSSLVLDHANEEEKMTVMHEYSHYLTTPELSGGSNSIHMESTQPQDSKTSDEGSVSHSSNGSKTMQEGSPAPKFNSTEKNGDKKDSEISKTTNTKSSTSSTKPKAPSKKTTATCEQRRSVRLNGPPKKQTLRKRK